MADSDAASRPLESHVRVDADFGGLAFNLQQGLFIPDDGAFDVKDPLAPFYMEGDW